jgi:predicted enzyme related to lactoylglutathione lyase
MANPVNWFHISVKEVAPIAKFYGEAFDWKLGPGPGGVTFADTGAGGIHGGISGIMDGSDKPSVLIYVGTADIDAQLARIEKAGGRPSGPKMPLPEGMGAIAHFHDPAGNLVGLWEGGPQAAPAAPKRRAAAKKAAKKSAAKKTATKKPAAKKAAKKSAAKKTAKKR